MKFNSKDDLLSLGHEDLIKLLNEYEIKPGNIKLKTAKKLKINALWKKLEAERTDDTDNENKENNSTHSNDKSDLVNSNASESADQTAPNTKAETPTILDKVETLLDKSKNEFYVVKPSTAETTPVEQSKTELDGFIFNKVTDATKYLKVICKSDKKAATMSRKFESYQKAKLHLLDTRERNFSGNGPKTASEMKLNNSPKLGEKDFLQIKYLVERRRDRTESANSLTESEAVEHLENYLRENPNRIMTRENGAPIMVSPNFHWNVIHYAVTKEFFGVLDLYHKLLTDKVFIKSLYENTSYEMQIQNAKRLHFGYFTTADKIAHDTPLHLAAKLANPVIVEFLLYTANLDGIGPKIDDSVYSACLKTENKSKELPEKIIGKKLMSNIRLKGGNETSNAYLIPVQKCQKLFRELWILKIDINTTTGVNNKFNTVRYNTNSMSFPTNKTKSYIGPSDVSSLERVKQQLNVRWSSAPMNQHLVVERRRTHKSDWEKGILTHARILCKRNDLILNEYWPFLNDKIIWNDDSRSIFGKIDGFLATKYPKPNIDKVEKFRESVVLDDTIDRLCDNLERFSFKEPTPPHSPVKSCNEMFLEGTSATKTDVQFHDATKQFFTDEQDTREELEDEFPTLWRWYKNISSKYSKVNQRKDLRTPMRRRVKLEL